MSAGARRQVLRLYKSLLRESSKFDAYNYRFYAIRRIKDSFRANKDLTDNTKIKDLVENARSNLDMIRRQVIIGQMYSTNKLVIENA